MDLVINRGPELALAFRKHEVALNRAVDYKVETLIQQESIPFYILAQYELILPRHALLSQ